MRITKLMMVETGTYNDQFFRPYRTNMDMGVLASFQEATHAMPRITPTSIAGIASQIMAPTAEPQGNVNIVNGWDTRRFRFVMEVEVEDPTPLAAANYSTELLTGYTDYLGANPSGAIDPNMKFYFNNSVLVRRSVMSTPVGQHTQFTVTNASHVLANNMLLAGQQPVLHTPFSGADTAYLRPTDVMANMQIQTLTGGGEVHDLRSMPVGTTAMKSARANGMAANHIAQCVNAINRASLEMQSDPGQNLGFGTVYTNARTFANEGSIRMDKFLTYLQDNTHYRQTRYVTFSQLCMIQPGLDAIAAVIFNGGVHQRTPVAQRGQTENWSTTTNETVVANMLGFMMPSIMMDLMLTKLTFSATNMTLDGSYQIKVDKALSFANIDLSPYIQRCVDRITTEVMPAITHQNQIGVNVMMAVDVAGDTFIRVSYGGGPFTDYNMPSFGDALFSPIVAPSNQYLPGLSHDIAMLADYNGTSVQNHMSIVPPAATDFTGEQNVSANPLFASTSRGLV